MFPSAILSRPADNSAGMGGQPFPSGLCFPSSMTGTYISTTVSRISPYEFSVSINSCNLRLAFRKHFAISS